MIQLRNAIEIFKILPRSNCRECGIPTCLAFAAAVFKGDRRLNDCKHMDKSALETFRVQNADSRAVEQEQREVLERLSLQIAALDLASSAER